MARLVPLLLCISLMASGCVLRGDGRKFAYTVDGAMVAVGAGATASAISSSCPSGGRSDGPYSSITPDADGLGCELDKLALVTVGVLLVTAGLLGAAMNAAANQNLTEPSEEALAATPIADSGQQLPIPNFCAAAIHAFNDEDDPALRDQRYAAMTPECRALIRR